MSGQSQVQHLAVIMDGNGRWARRRGLPRTAGHKAGVKSARQLIESCREHNIEFLTLFAFSSENWKRPDAEVNMLMELFISTIDKEFPSLAKHDVRLRFIGDIEAFSPELQHKMQDTERRTADNNGLKLNIAVNYGGRADIVLAAKKLASDAIANNLDLSDLTAERFGRYVCLADAPEPDLLIRTGGEYRISNFLLWQMAYTELYFTDKLWPTFNSEALKQALTWYHGRQRRFGETPEQAQEKSERLNHA